MYMKIILLQDEKKLGKKGEIIEASEGYARNYILPKKIGVEATPKNLNDLKLQKANEKKVADELLAKAQELAQKLRQNESRRRGQNLWSHIHKGDCSRIAGSTQYRD